MYANACKLQKNTFHPTMYLVSSHRDNFTMQLQSACNVNKINCYLRCISFHPHTGMAEAWGGARRGPFHWKGLHLFQRFCLSDLAPLPEVTAVQKLFFLFLYVTKKNCALCRSFLSNQDLDMFRTSNCLSELQFCGTKFAKK